MQRYNILLVLCNTKYCIFKPFTFNQLIIKAKNSLTTTNYTTQSNEILPLKQKKEQINLPFFFDIKLKTILLDQNVLIFCPPKSLQKEKMQKEVRRPYPLHPIYKFYEHSSTAINIM